EHAAVDQVVQRHAQHRREADDEPGNAAKLALRQRRKPRAREQNSRRRRDVRPHEQREREEKPGAEGAREAIARLFPQSAEQQHESGEKEDIGGGIGKAARRPFYVLHQARAEEHADRNRGEHERERQRPGQRQEAPEQGEDQERQDENEREI